jgi:Tfp pilus assembly protein PilX
MFVGLTTVVCIAVFVVSAFALRIRMHRLSAVYEARIKTLAAAEAVLLEQGDINGVQLELESVVKNTTVMRRNAMLFRLLWPEEYDRAFYTGQRLIAQYTRIVALGSR